MKTLSIIKPHAVKSNLSGAINSYIEKAGFSIIAQKMIHMDVKQAEAFYAVHRDKQFFYDLCKIMSDGPCIVQVLTSSKYDDVIKAYRDLMGSTNPQNASPGTLRNVFGESIDFNAVHGSDSHENAITEVSFFFKSNEIF
ncbi:nucleoside-diphosphate kinase [Candidatus Gromoviella agglomerans]|uniref:nucleoside-diphosphate kinase n=1 Tax=Candidatus Gromoviella agglomerans TaxID=2806609 RepID=UPI001E53BA15|nr:nucleoside-diphosphate kinase [Candidatus Gromoviella agglomerans]UFX98524.1 Nucleoside diphosphate kinase [Candidatus Gromoviella agglomerans]